MINHLPSFMSVAHAWYPNIMPQVHVKSLVAGVAGTVIGTTLLRNLTHVYNALTSELDDRVMPGSHANGADKGHNLFAIYATSAAIFGTGSFVLGFLSATSTGLSRIQTAEEAACKLYGENFKQGYIKGYKQGLEAAEYSLTPVSENSELSGASDNDELSHVPDDGD